MDKNIYPHIIAVGSSHSDISHFYVAVENHLIDVSVWDIPILLELNLNYLYFSQVSGSADWKITQIIDLFFKVHLIFDLKFEININPTMTFFARFLYGFKGNAFKPTLTMNNLEAKIASAIAAPELVKTHDVWMLMNLINSVWWMKDGFSSCDQVKTISLTEPNNVQVICTLLYFIDLESHE